MIKDISDVKYVNELLKIYFYKRISLELYTSPIGQPNHNKIIQAQKKICVSKSTNSYKILGSAKSNYGHQIQTDVVKCHDFGIKDVVTKLRLRKAEIQGDLVLLATA